MSTLPNSGFTLSETAVKRRCFLRYSLAAIAAVGLVRPVRAEPGITGHSAPQLKVPHWIDGKGQAMKFDANSLHGRWVVMKFFQSWCPGCHSHGFPTMQSISKEFGEHPQVRLLAVQTVFEGFTTNTQDRLQEMQDRYDLRIPFGHDAGSPQGDHLPRTMRDYRSGGTPWLVIVSPDRQVIFDGFRLSASKFADWLRPQLKA
ncbi:MAG: thiol-disulfide isomerase/thioredoxin [Gammaproteobacteria bacterium]|jgi:thiol-disulfide isomerase/thioredoxin